MLVIHCDHYGATHGKTWAWVAEEPGQQRCCQSGIVPEPANTDVGELTAILQAVQWVELRFNESGPQPALIVTDSTTALIKIMGSAEQAPKHSKPWNADAARLAADIRRRLNQLGTVVVGWAARNNVAAADDLTRQEYLRSFGHFPHTGWRGAADGRTMKKLIEHGWVWDGRVESVPGQHEAWRLLNQLKGEV